MIQRWKIVLSSAVVAVFVAGVVGCGKPDMGPEPDKSKSGGGKMPGGMTSTTGHGPGGAPMGGPGGPPSSGGPGGGGSGAPAGGSGSSGSGSGG